MGVAERIRTMLDINGWENIPVATITTPPVSPPTCELCGGDHPAIGYVVWRTEIAPEPGEPWEQREEDLRVCYDAILNALEIAGNDPGFISAHVEIFE